jgi:predicted nucleic acid-binding protein
MRLVLAINILVSALISRSGPTDQLAPRRMGDKRLRVSRKKKSRS